MQNKLLRKEVPKTVDIRQRLLQKEFEDLKLLPIGCSVIFDNPDVLSEFLVIIKPDSDSLWYGGTFEFLVQVPESYNFEVISNKSCFSFSSFRFYSPLKSTVILKYGIRT